MNKGVGSLGSLVLVHSVKQGRESESQSIESTDQEAVGTGGFGATGDPPSKKLKIK